MIVLDKAGHYLSIRVVPRITLPSLCGLEEFFITLWLSGLHVAYGQNPTAEGHASGFVGLMRFLSTGGNHHHCPKKDGRRAFYEQNVYKINQVEPGFL
jgi:hypothetical protein